MIKLVDVKPETEERPAFELVDVAQPDLTKVKGRDISNSSNPQRALLNVVNSVAGMVGWSGMAKDTAIEAPYNLAYNMGKSLVTNADTIGEYATEVPKTILRAGKAASEKLQETGKAIEARQQEQELYEFTTPDPNDTWGAFTKEAVKGAASEIVSNTPKMASDIFYWLGKNMQDHDNKSTNDMAESFLGLSDMFNNVSTYMGDIDLLKSKSGETSSGRLSLGQIGSVAGHGVGQGLTMATMARLFGTKAAYGFMAGAGGAGVFKESLEKDGDIGKANTLAALNTQTTYMIDRWFNPLPENIATGARLTAKEVGKEIAKAAIKEPITEGLQQTFAENLVRKIGIDAEQDLFEGVVESMIGALGGAAAMGGASAVSAYYADRNYERAKQRAVELGAKEAEVEKYRRATEMKLKQHPEAFNAVFQKNLQNTINDINAFAKENGNTEEVRRALQTKQELEDVYTNVYNRLKEVGVADNVASADAKIWQGIALWGSQEMGVSPAEYMKRMPKIERATYEQFKNRNQTLREVLDDDIPYQLPQEAHDAQGKADVNSVAFKRWSGNSHVVSAQKAKNYSFETGKAVTVEAFHGTKTRGIEVFEYDKNRQTGTDYGEAYYATTDYDKASGYAYDQLKDKRVIEIDNRRNALKKEITEIMLKEGKNEKTDQLMAEFSELSDRKYNIVQAGTAKDSDGAIMPIYMNFRNPLVVNADNKFYFQVYNEYFQEARSKGYDGIIVKNVIDNPRGEQRAIDVFIVFNSNQIKSVYNRGTFDPNNDNIYYQGQIADNGRNVELTINSQEETQGLSDEDFKAKMLDTLKSFKGNKIFNQSLNGDIEIRTSSIKKYKSFFADKNKRLIVPYIPELLAKAKFISEKTYTPETEKNIVAYWKADLPINIDSDGYDVHLTVKEDDKGNFFWDAHIKEKARRTVSATNPSVGGLQAPRTDPATNPGVKGLTSELSEDGLSITQTSENVNKTLYQEREVPKGAYMKNLDYNGIIYLFERADASTFMHETAHFFKEELKRFDTARSREMLKKVDEWENSQFGQRYNIKEENGSYAVTDKLGMVVYDNFDSAERAREYAKSEIFARGFEQYLRDGQAPNNYLKQAFRSFWGWLQYLYKSAKQLNVSLNEDIKAVYADIIGGKDLDFYLSAPVDEVLQQHFEEQKERKDYLDEQISIAQAQTRPVKKGFAANLAQEKTDGAKGRNEWWSKAIIPISTRAKRVNQGLKNRLRAYDFNLANKLNSYYAEVKPFLDKWAKMTETDAVAFDLALKNSYMEKQFEIVKRYDAYDEFVRVKNLLNSLFDQAVDFGIEMGYTADYFPRQIKDVDGFMSYIYGSPMSSQLRRALREADPDNVMKPEERAEFLNKYLRGFNRRDLNKPLPGNTKDRKIDIVTAALNQYYAPSMEALISYIEGMNTAIESRRFWGFKYDDINRSIGAFTAQMIDDGLIKPEQDAEVQEILKARFNARGVHSGWLNWHKNMAYIYTMGGINSAITQIDDLSMSLYKAGFWNTVQSVFSKNRPGLSREELGLEKIGQEFAEASASSKLVSAVFKATGLDKIDAFGKNTLINATFNKFQKMANTDEAALRERIAPVLEMETDQTIEDIKNGVISENVKLLMFNELADVQPIALSEMPEWYLTSGNGRVFYMLKSFALKRIDIFRNECFDKIRNGQVKEGLQNLFRLAMLMMICGASKDMLIDLLYGRDVELSETFINNLLGLTGIVNKYSLYKLRDEGFSGILSAQIPPIFPLYSDLVGDVYKSLFTKKGKDVSDYEVWKGLPLIGRFYYWWLGGGHTKLERKEKKKLK